jgi:hypothetical protein
MPDIFHAHLGADTLPRASSAEKAGIHNPILFIFHIKGEEPPWQT